MTCKQCSKEVGESSSFCNNCGIKCRPSSLDNFDYRMKNFAFVSEDSTIQMPLSMMNQPGWNFFASQAANALSKGEPYEAIEYYTRAISLNPLNSKIYQDRGYTYLELSKFELADADFDKCLSFNADDLFARINRAASKNSQSKHFEAIADLNYVLSRDSKNLYALRDRASCYANIEQYDIALLDIENALQIEPNNSDTLHLARIITNLKAKMNRSK